MQRGRIAGLLLGFAVATALPALAADTPAEILVTRQLAEVYDVAVGDTVSLSADPTGADARSFRVAGIYEPTPDPTRFTAKRREVRLHLPDLLALTAAPGDVEALESVDTINVALADPADALAFATDLMARLPGLVPSPTRSEADPFVVLERFHVAIAVVAVIGASMFLLALMVMRVEERRETVGILRLVGLSRRRILLEVLVEGLLIAFAGALFGVVFARATEGLVNLFFQHRYDTALVFLRVTAGIALRCVAIAVPLGVAAGFVASWTLLRRDVVELLRR